MSRPTPAGRIFSLALTLSQDKDGTNGNLTCDIFCSALGAVFLLPLHDILVWSFKTHLCKLILYFYT